MPEHHDHMNESQPEPHHHNCGSLFGCGEEQGTGVVREDVKDAKFTRQAADRLLHMDEVDQENLDHYLSTRGRFRRKLLQASSFMGMLAAVGPWFNKASHSGEGFGSGEAIGSGQHSASGGGEGRVHVVESNNQTVHLGVFDTTLAPIIKIDSGDTVSFPNTWSHFLNQLQPGVPVDKLAQIRVSNPGRGPHSIIGPIFVNDAQPGDVLEIRYKKLLPFNWGAVFNNPGTLGTGLLPQDFPQGQVKYLDLDLKNMKAEFVPRIHIPLKPFQGTLGVAPPDGYYPPVSPGVTSSVPPGPHGGNVDLSEMSEGSSMFIPVWKAGALIYTGDSHAVQGDGEINLSALETRMQEMRIQVVLHKQKNFSWPIAETATHWILLGLDKDLNVAMTLAARNAIKFLSTRAGLTELDAYALCSIAVSFRITQVVDIVRGVHAMIPKSLFDADLRRQIAVV
ncbi:MAG TPA: acetamidase/formamidase family protein [Candidatus Solibacter sp.]|nr:acetamidase/formamidase family protein [Candidatus Solibacter sp.]